MDVEATVFLTVAAGVSAGGYGFRLLRAPVSWWRSGLKLVPAAAMAGIAAHLGGPGLLVLGLVLAAIGDLFLSRTGREAFLTGRGAFLVAHFAYATLFWSLRAEVIFLPMLLPLAGVCVFAVIMAALLWRRARDFRLPVLLYILATTLMVLTAMLVPFGHRLITLGAMLFMLSDSVLAMEAFVLSKDDVRRKSTSAIIWWSYIVAQACILIGVMGAVDR